MNAIKYKRINNPPGGDPSLSGRITILEDNEYKITYFATISAATGTITKPTNSTILLDQFAGGVDAYVSTIVNGQPTGIFPQTAGGVIVDVSSFDTSGNFTLSGTPSAFDVALIYILKIKAIDYVSLTTANILDLEDVNTPQGSGTTNELTYWSGIKTLGSLTTATYPSLTELSYVKGLSSAAQTQIDSKASTTDIRFKSNDMLAREALGSTIVASSFDLSRTTSAIAMADGRVYFISCYLRTAQTITGVKWLQDVQGNYTADNYNGVGLYSYSGGTLTLVASSTDDGNIWKGTAGTVQSKAFSSTYVASAGLYFIGLLYNNSAVVTNPSIECMTTLRGGEVATFDFTNSGKLFAFLSGQTALPTPQASSGLTVHTVPIFAALY